jgi:hypothetical protein
METKEKKQVVNSILKSTNILVTVGIDPSVDELAALLGLTLMLGKLDKHATAVFSGRIPSAISFLEPDKTFEDTVDGLRDFIIALNKDKADHLRYKLDGDVVKIFITPYKNTIIRDTDLQFSQGDFNVELILALGVANKTDLDTAVSAHGRILHDATTITLTSGGDKSELGEIDWHAPTASSLCEMLVSLSRELGENLLDEHVATALLTGIVSNTERFSNNLTTSDVMKTAATLMAAGANQQLIAARLEPVEEPRLPALEPLPVMPAGPTGGTEDEDTDGTMTIAHDAAQAEEADRSPLPVGPSLVDIERDKDQVLQDALSKVIPKATFDLDDLVDAEKNKEASAPQPRHFIAKATGFDELEEPRLGGTLNATTEMAEEDARAAIEDDRNRVILTHDAPLGTPVEPPVESEAPAPVPQPKPVEEAAPASRPLPAPSPSVDDALETLGYPAGSHPTLADLDYKTGHDTPHPLTPSIVSVPGSPTAKPPLEVDDARAAVANALDSAFAPANNPTAAIGSQPLGDGLHDSAPVVLAAPVIAPAPVQPASTAISLPPLPPLPPLPGQGNVGALPPLPPLPDLGELDMHADSPAAAAAAGPTENDWQTHTVEPPADDPGQFHIPGQK